MNATINKWLVATLILTFLLTGISPDSVQARGQKVVICHKPGTSAQKTMSVPPEAVKGHLGHGDYLGKCKPKPTKTPPAPTSTPGPGPVDPPAFVSSYNEITKIVAPKKATYHPSGDGGLMYTWLNILEGVAFCDKEMNCISLEPPKSWVVVKNHRKGWMHIGFALEPGVYTVWGYGPDGKTYNDGEVRLFVEK